MQAEDEQIAVLTEFVTDSKQEIMKLKKEKDAIKRDCLLSKKQLEAATVRKQKVQDQVHEANHRFKQH